MNLDLVIHEQTAAAVQQYLARPSHAVLLSGAEGLGKTLLARAIAEELLGRRPGTLGDYEHFRLITPLEGKQTIVVEQIRDLQPFLALKVPGKQGISRIVLLDDAHLMNVQAQNALLKMLEEPPVGTVLLLITSRPDQLLPTIRSRVTSIAVHAPSGEQVVRYFSGQGHTEATIRRALLMSDGSLKRMQELLSDTEGQSTMFDAVKQLLGSNNFERLCQIDAVAKDKQVARQFVTALQQLADASARRAAETGAASLAKWFGILQAAITADEALAKNGNAKLVLTDLVLAL